MNKKTGKYTGYTEVKYVGGRLSRGKAANGLYALFNCDTGEALTEAIYEGVRVSSSNSQYITIIRDGMIGLIDMQGNEVVKPIYQHLSDPQYGVIIFKQNDKFGLMSDKFEILIPSTFTKLRQYGGIFIVNAGEDEFLMRASGEIFSRKYKSIGMFLYSSNTQMSYAIIQDENGYGIINIRGEETVHCDYENIAIANGYKSLYIAKKKGYYSLITSYGGIVVNGRYISAKEVFGGVEFRTEDGQRRYFNYVPKPKR